MPEEATRARVANQRAVTDANIEEAALRLLATVGTDGLTLPAIAKESGMTTGPVYARYGGVDDVLVVLWDLYLHEELVRILTLQITWVNSDQPLPDSLRQLLETPGTKANAVVELMATMRRYPFAHSTIQPQIDQIFTSIALAHPDIPRAVVHMQLGFVLGAIFAKPIFASSFATSLAESAQHIQLLSLRREGWDATSEFKDVTPVAIPPRVDDGPVRQAFLNGALETIAITGVEGASAQRIARAAGYGFSSAYSYFKSKEELAEEAIQMVMTQLLTLDRDSDLIQDHDEYIRRITAFVRGGLSEEGRLVRQLRVECVIAARHSVRIRQFAQSRFNEVLVHALHRNFGRRDGEFSMVATWAVVATHNFAFPLVAGCTRYLDGIDWTPMAEQLYLVRNNFKA